MRFRNKSAGDEGDSFVALTDLSLTTLMMFVLFFLVIFLASLSEDLPQWAKRVDALKKLKQEEENWKEKVETMREAVLEERVQVKMKGLEMARSEGEELQAKDENLNNRNLTISMLTRLAEVKLKEGQLLEGLDQSRSDESALNELYRQMKQEVQSLRKIVENPYLNTSTRTPVWRMNVRENEGQVTFSFGHPRSRWYSRKEMEKILASLNPGDGIKVFADGWEDLGNYQRAVVLGLFEEYGWPPLAIQNFGAKEAMLRLYGGQ